MVKFICLVIVLSILPPGVSVSAPSKTSKFKIDPRLDFPDDDPLPPSPKKSPPRFLKNRAIVCPALKKQFRFLLRGVNSTPKNDAWRISRFYAAARVADEAIRRGCWRDE